MTEALDESNNSVERTNDASEDASTASAEISSCKQCSIEHLNVNAVGFCIDCRQHLCEKCSTRHRKGAKLAHIIIDETTNVGQPKNGISNQRSQRSTRHLAQVESGGPIHEKFPMDISCHYPEGKIPTDDSNGQIKSDCERDLTATANIRHDDEV